MQIEHFEIADRFCGPPRSGNGGYTCGQIAKQLSGSVSVRLKAPPPLHTELRLESSENGAQLFHGSTLIGEARCVQLELQPPPNPSFAEAKKAAQLFSGFKLHPFPGCFVCGTDRQQVTVCAFFPALWRTAQQLPRRGRLVLALPMKPAISNQSSSGPRSTALELLPSPRYPKALPPFSVN